ncbi:MAG: para-nitrobenzyl esterase, partial [Flavobacteriales bacterium]
MFLPYFSIMKRLLLCAAASLTAVLSTAQCDGNRFFNQVFNDYTEIENIVYGENINYQGSTTELLLDVYQPVGDIETARPLIVMVHGGSFIGGSKDGVDVTSLASDFTKMGYVVASINYRLGLPITLDLETPATEAVVRGYHDAKAAVRFFRKDIAESGNTY